jgi:hypothetical protein
MRKDDPVVALIKFAERQYIESFIRGELYMKPLSYFAGVESDACRRDRREGQSAWLPRGSVLQVELNGKYETVPGIRELAFMKDGALNANVFCMYALRASVAAEKCVPADVLDFGDTFAFIGEGNNEFLRRVRAAALHTGQDQLATKLVEYVDRKTYHGPVGIFRKDAQFCWQNEFRIALLPGTGLDYVFKVGDLSDITVVGSLESVDELNERF